MGCDEISFTCKLSHKGKKAKWYLRNQECYKGKKFGFIVDDDVFTLIIKNPEVNDSGRYQCVIRECNDLTCKAYLEVEPPDPVYGLMENDDGNLTLTIKEARVEDTGKYTCKIEEFGKEGDDETTCDVTIGEFPHKFTNGLEGKNVVEEDKVEFKLECEEDDAEVKWFKDGIEIIPDGKRIQIVKEGKKRKLVINGAKMEDAGKITAKTNADETSCDLGVKHNNKFIKGMREFKQCVEREEIIFNVQVSDPNAPVTFAINGEDVVPDGDRIETKDLGEGKHQLIIHKAKMGDMGNVVAKTPSNKGDVAPVSGVAKKQCNMTIPYEVAGEKQSELEIWVEKDGKLLKIGKDIQLTMHGDRVQLDVINPKREKSGVYKVVMKNAQGQDEKLINVNIMDIPTEPLNVYVDTVYQDNCVVHWSPPKDNGGTEIKKYIVEAMDTTTGNGSWTEVTQTASGTENKIRCDGLKPLHKYRFRVKAVNKIGISDPGEMKGPDILMKDPWDEPDPPGQPQIVDWGPDFGEMTFTKPPSDGGAEITEYVIEMKEKNMGQWVHGKTLKAKDIQDLGNSLKVKQDGLIEGCEYQFRIKAVNKGGPSKPSPPSVPMIAKTRFLPPH